jgi:hypothetical protein
MINPIQSNAATRVTEQSAVSAPVNRAPVAPQEDVVEISSFGKEYEGYMKALKNLPDVRADVVAEVNERSAAPKPYPPLDIIAGISALIGQQIS